MLVDVANALDFSAGFPPGLAVMSTDSLAEHFLPLWLGLLGVIGRDQPFNIRVVR